MTEQVTTVYALCVDGPCAGGVYEVPLMQRWLLLHGHPYRYVTVANGVVLYEVGR